MPHLAEKYRFITIEGNTGAGKTTLARMLAEQYGGKLILEEFAENPYLADFYTDPDRYAFHTEVYFMLDRQAQIKQLLDSGQLNQGFNVSDYLFIKSLLYAEVTLPPHEFRLFERMFRAVYPQLPQPDCTIYVHSTVPRLIRNIQKRGRDFEQVVEGSYLQKVEDVYFQYFYRQPQQRTLILHTDELDFVENDAHYQQIVAWVNADYAAGVHHLSLR